MENNESPCRDCMYDYGCGNYKECRAWRMWFSNEWFLVKMMFMEEEEDDETTR